MIRNKFRLRFLHQALDPNLYQILTDNPETAKSLYRFKRDTLVYFLAENSIPKTSNNVVYVINEIQLHNKDISDLAPSTLIERCRNYGTIKVG